MKDNLLFGFVPDEITEVISSQYVRYLDVFDPPMSATIRRRIVELSFTFPDPPVVRWGNVWNETSCSKSDRFDIYVEDDTYPKEII